MGKFALIFSSVAPSLASGCMSKEARKARARHRALSTLKIVACVDIREPFSGKANSKPEEAASDGGF